MLSNVKRHLMNGRRKRALAVLAAPAAAVSVALGAGLPPPARVMSQQRRSLALLFFHSLGDCNDCIGK